MKIVLATFAVMTALLCVWLYKDAQYESAIYAFCDSTSVGAHRDSLNNLSNGYSLKKIEQPNGHVRFLLTNQWPMSRQYHCDIAMSNDRILSREISVTW